MSRPGTAIATAIFALLFATGCHRAGEGNAASTDADADADGDIDADADGDGDTDTGLEPCGGGTFDVEPLEWALPGLPPSYTDEDPFPGYWTFEGQLFSAPVDLDLDGRIDLLAFSSAVDPAVGDEYWMLFQGGDGGFTGGLALWSLPLVPGVPEGWRPWSSPWDEPHSCSDYQQQYTTGLEDMDGDGLYDLVLADACDEGGVGTTHWLVYPSSGSGFPAEPVIWELPPSPGIASDSFLDEPYPMWHGFHFACAEIPWHFFKYMLSDMNGDCRPDLVVTDHCDPGGVGGDRFEVHFNTGAGFEAEATPFPLPADLVSDGEVLSETSGLEFREMDGDGRADFVLGRGEAPEGLGVEFWLVWRNNGAGFAPAIEWTLPPTPMGDQVFSPSNNGALCDNGGMYRYTFDRDMDMDGRLDLLITEDCEVGGIGDDVWIVHLNTGSGFDPVGTEWCLPPANPFQGAADPFDNLLLQKNECQGGWWAYRIMDMNDDGCRDLVVTDNCDVGGVGQTHWRAYLDPCE